MKKTNKQKKPKKQKRRYLEQTDFQGWWDRPSVNFVLVKRSGLQGRGVVYLPLKVYLEDLLESDKPPALGQASTSSSEATKCLHSAERQSATREKSLGLHPNVASGLVTFGWDVWKKKTVLNYRLLFFKKLKNKNNTNRIKKGKIFCHFEKLSIKTAGKIAPFTGHHLS